MTPQKSACGGTTMAMPNTSGTSSRQDRLSAKRPAKYLLRTKFTVSPEIRKMSGMRH